MSQVSPPTPKEERWRFNANSNSFFSSQLLPESAQKDLAASRPDEGWFEAGCLVFSEAEVVAVAGESWDRNEPEAEPEPELTPPPGILTPPEVQVGSEWGEMRVRRAERAEAAKLTRPQPPDHEYAYNRAPVPEREARPSQSLGRRSFLPDAFLIGDPLRFFEDLSPIEPLRREGGRVSGEVRLRVYDPSQIDLYDVRPPGFIKGREEYFSCARAPFPFHR